MDVDQVSSIFKKSFAGLTPDKFGRTITTIKAPRTFHKPSHDTAKTPDDLLINGKFVINKSLVKGDGLLAAPAFVCFKSE